MFCTFIQTSYYRTQDYKNQYLLMKAELFHYGICIYHKLLIIYVKILCD